MRWEPGPAVPASWHPTNSGFGAVENPSVSCLIQRFGLCSNNHLRESVRGILWPRTSCTGPYHPAAKYILSNV